MLQQQNAEFSAPQQYATEVPAQQPHFSRLLEVELTEKFKFDHCKTEGIPKMPCAFYQPNKPLASPCAKSNKYKKNNPHFLQ